MVETWRNSNLIVCDACKSNNAKWIEVLLTVQDQQNRHHEHIKQCAVKKSKKHLYCEQSDFAEKMEPY